jgi:CYTH domain-containing protein
MEAYWRLDRAIGKEPKAGTIADLAQLGDRPARTVERERKFLVTGPPPVAGTGDHIRQGYFAIDRTVSARVRERSGWASTMTVKAGSGATRTELEWELAPEIFDLLWPLAEGRCIDKTRYEVAVGDHTAEVDVFGGTLGGLCLVEVEFDSDAAMAAFIPPDWFGAEVTDDGRYANAHLATHGLAED